MIVYFEGVSCSGKTHLINELKKGSKTPVFCVEELPVEYSTIKDIDNFCRKNDERKSKVALSEAKNKIVLVDRGYASTLAYNYIQYVNKTSKEYIKSLSWYKQKITSKKIVKPDLYVFIKLNPKTAIKRAKKLNRFSNSIAWYDNPNLGNEFYDAFFKYFEPEVPLLVFNGEESVKSMARKFWKRLRNDK